MNPTNPIHRQAIKKLRTWTPPEGVTAKLIYMPISERLFVMMKYKADTIYAEIVDRIGPASKAVLTLAAQGLIEIVDELNARPNITNVDALCNEPQRGIDINSVYPLDTSRMGRDQ